MVEFTTTLIASATLNVSFVNHPKTISVSFLKNSAVDSILEKLRSASFNAENSLSLHFIGLKGKGVFPIVKVYLNLENPEELEEQNYLGALGLYGLEESSTPSSTHGGGGMHVILDVGKVFQRMRKIQNWSGDDFNLTFVVDGEISEEAELVIGKIELRCSVF